MDDTLFANKKVSLIGSTLEIREGFSEQVQLRVLMIGVSPRHAVKSIIIIPLEKSKFIDISLLFPNGEADLANATKVSSNMSCDCLTIEHDGRLIKARLVRSKLREADVGDYEVKSSNGMK